MATTQRVYRDYDLAELVFGPGGVWEYLEEKNRFRNKFGATLNRRSFVDIIARIVPEVDRWNKDRRNIQPFASIYNMAVKGERSKDTPGQCHAIERTYEILYVYCFVESSKIDGLKEYLTKRGYGDLLVASEELYKNLNKERKKAIYMHDIAEQIWSRFDGLEKLIEEKDEALLSALQHQKDRELKEARAEYELTKKEIREEFEKTPDEELRKKIYLFIENL